MMTTQADQVRATWMLDASGIRRTFKMKAFPALAASEHALVVSSLTWDPDEPPGLPKRARSVLTAGGRRHVGGNLVAMPLASRSFDDKQESIDGMLRQLLRHGLLTVDVVCTADLPHIAYCEQNWRRAGLLAPAHREAYAVVVAAGRLGVPIAAADADVQRIARFCGVQAITVETFAAAIAA
jgi:hypothetical protein